MFGAPRTELGTDRVCRRTTVKGGHLLSEDEPADSYDIFPTPENHLSVCVG
jgi:hypothetical protein